LGVSRPQTDRGTELARAGLVAASYLGGCLSQICLALSILALPVAAIWCAELNADRHVLAGPESRNDMLRAMQMIEATPRWWLRPFTSLTHPPPQIRRFMVSLETGPARVMLGMLFPLAYLPKLALLTGFVAIPIAVTKAYAGTFDEMVLAGVWGQIAKSAGNLVAFWSGTWFALAGVLLVWPWLWPSWVWLVSACRPARVPCRGFFLCALLIGLAAFAARFLAS
jgi:hypothetical protein